jgi:branched-chain amino acid transport system ATP-binding protein
MSTLNVNSLSAGYNGTPIVRDVEICVQSGRCAALLGVNGCGKTTILRAIAGLAETFGGEITLDNNSLTALAPYRRRQAGVLYLPQWRRVFPNLSVRETLELTCDFPQRCELRNAVRVLPELGPLLSRSGRQLSGGETQIIALARLLLVRHPRLLLLDEPIGELAPDLRERARDVIHHTLSRSGAACLIVEHDQGFVESVAEELLLVKDGEVTGVTKSAPSQAIEQEG